MGKHDPNREFILNLHLERNEVNGSECLVSLMHDYQEMDTKTRKPFNYYTSTDLHIVFEILFFVVVNSTQKVIAQL